MKVLSVSVTQRGKALASRLPFEGAHGCAAETVRKRWAEVDAFILFLATGAAVRIVAPLLADKRIDPAVVFVDEAGRFAVALCGGHAGGANGLARRVASLLGATPVVTTASDAVGLPALDQLHGFAVEGDVAGVMAPLLEGRTPIVENPLGWPLPSELTGATKGELSHATGPPPRIVVSDRDKIADAREGTVVLRPPSLIAGIGASRGAPAEEVAALLSCALATGGLAPASVAEVATVEHKASEPALLALGFPLRAFSAPALAEISVPSPSEVVRASVGTPSVAEAAALLAAGPDAELVVTKVRSDHATVALARRRHPPGRLAVIGLGPGHPRHRTSAAEVAVRNAEVVVGYGPYVDQCADLLAPGARVVRRPIGEEVVRAKMALREAAEGRRVALVCSGDAGVYAMASIALELAAAQAPAVSVEVVPGITAALAAAAVLGAPLGHDHAIISLSDLLTPWETIARRIEAAAAADLAVAFYNPRSRGRTWQLNAARELLLNHRSPSTPVGVVTDVARPGEQVTLTTLADLDSEEVGMTTCVVVGSSPTRILAGRMVTPRGYQP